MMKPDMEISSKSVPILKIGDIIDMHYYSNKTLKIVPARVINGVHPNYTLEFKVKGKIIRAFTTER